MLCCSSGATCWAQSWRAAVPVGRSVGRSVGPIKHLGAVLQFWCDMLGTELEGSCTCRSVGRSVRSNISVLCCSSDATCWAQSWRAAVPVGRSVGPIKPQKCSFLLILKQKTWNTIQEADSLKTKERFTTMYCRVATVMPVQYCQLAGWQQKYK